MNSTVHGMIILTAVTALSLLGCICFAHLRPDIFFPRYPDDTVQALSHLMETFGEQQFARLDTDFTDGGLVFD